MSRRTAGVLSFVLSVVVLIAVLKGLNWLPTTVRKDLLKRYDTLEGAAAGSNLGEVLVPAYIPQNLKWPPSAILAQGKPYPALVMEFERIDGRDTVLVISQSASAALRLDGKIRVEQVKERVVRPFSRALIWASWMARRATSASASGLWREIASTAWR